MAQEHFLNYYEVLQVSPKADQETIDRVYRLLARRYHPDNAKSGDAEKFDQLAKAYHILSDQKKRTDYDASHEGIHSFSNKRLAETFQINGEEDDEKVYQSILFLLYLARRRDAGNAGVGIVDLERKLGVPEKHLEFHIWYLKEKGWIQRLDTGGYAITAGGVDAVIERDLMAKRHFLLPASSQNSAGSNGQDSADPDRSEQKILNDFLEKLRVFEKA
jgi:curved DNA-binding protein